MLFPELFGERLGKVRESGESRIEFHSFRHEAIEIVSAHQQPVLGDEVGFQISLHRLLLQLDDRRGRSLDRMQSVRGLQSGFACHEPVLRIGFIRFHTKRRPFPVISW